MFKIKTPHRRPLKHLLNMYGLFAVAATATVMLHLGAAVSGGLAVPEEASLLALCATFLTCAAISLVGGIVVTATLRRAFNLVQTGRLVQYSGFWLASWLGLKLSAYFFAAITLTAPITAGFLCFAIAFGLATALGEVPWRGRTWLPSAKRTAASPAQKPTGRPGQNSSNKNG